MRKLLLPILFLTLSVSSFAQDKAEEKEKTCYDKYYEVFKKRGADPVADGMHRNVIISVKDEYGTRCFLGKTRVEGGKVVAIWIKFSDETYDLFEANDFKDNKGAGIKNGISLAWTTKEGKTLNVIFKENIKPKRLEYKEAPDFDPDKL